LTDAGVVHLQQLPLQYLDLSCCGEITDAGLAYLQNLPLQHLTVLGCEWLTDAGLAHLREKRPLLRIDSCLSQP
jgi:hypothetical protein